MRAFRYRSKVKKICTISYKVSCGNEYLGAFARKYNRHVVINPTTIELSLHNYQSHKKIPQGAKVVIGWTGTQSTLKYLELIGPQLRALEEALPQVNFLVVADKMPTMKLNRLEYRAWSIETEIADLAEMDIGIMPLPDDEWTRGKCGFKALQYMAMRVPAVVSNVGVNSQIITDGIEGFVISTPDEWIEKLRKLVLDPELRTKMGIAAYEKVRNGYSTESNARNFLSLFE